MKLSHFFGLLSKYLSYFSFQSSCRGFSITEMVVAMGLASSLMGVAAMNMKKLEDPLQSGSAHLSSFIKEVRAEAISSTLAYTIKPVSSTKIITTYANKCSDTTQTTDPRVILNLPSGANLSNTSWDLCFTARGFPDGNIDVSLQDIGHQTKTVEVMLGGAVRIK